MQDLHKTIEAVIGSAAREQVLSRLVAEKLGAQGIALSKKEQRKLVTYILNGETGPIELRSRQFPKRHRSAVLEFDSGDGDRIDELTRNLTDRLPDLIESTASEVARQTLKTLGKRWPQEIHRQDKELIGFRRRLRGRWGSAIDLLRMLLTIAREFGGSVNEEIRQTPSVQSSCLVDVLVRLHARACQVSEEITCLLSAGLADGAMARWRTLHEIAVVALFISKHGEDIAERYTAHQHVEAWLATQRYQACHERLGYEPIEPDEIERVQNRYQATMDRYGAHFDSDLGWAIPAIGSGRPKFRDIEDAVGLDHLRAHYRMAGHNVHANPKGVFFKLGLLAETDILLAGASNAGLADPGHSAAISLCQISTALLPLQTTFDNLVALKIMLQLTSEIGNAFGKAHQRLLVDDGKHRRRQ